MFYSAIVAIWFLVQEIGNVPMKVTFFSSTAKQTSKFL